MSKEIKKMAFNNRKVQKLEEFNENPADEYKKTSLENSQKLEREIHAEVHTNEEQRRTSSPAEQKSRSNRRLPGKRPLVQSTETRNKKNNQ